MLNGRVMGKAVRRQNAVMVLNVSDIVSNWRAKQIGQLPARFFENYLRCARIPKLCPWRRMNINVAFLLSDQSDLQSDRTAPQRGRKFKSGNDRGHFF